MITTATIIDAVRLRLDWKHTIYPSENEESKCVDVNILNDFSFGYKNEANTYFGFDSNHN
jgi:hypothetical protein